MNFALTRKLIIFGLVLPLAAIVGFTLATPQDSKTFLLIAALTAVLLTPVMLKWYHPLLILTWNASINVYFMPGKPELWMLFTAIGFGILVLNSAMDREKVMIHVPALTLPLLFFLGVVLITAKLTGGIAVRALGGGGTGAMGGKGYFMIIFATLGYFVLTSRPIPVERVRNYLSLSFLFSATAVFSNLAYMLGPAFYFLFYLFPVEIAISQAVADMGAVASVTRVTGLAATGVGLFALMMARYGIRGIFDLQKPWRLAVFFGTLGLSLFGGFRSVLITYIVHFVIQFYFERLVRTKLCLFLVMTGVVLATLTVPFVQKLPVSIQRCLAFVPGLEVSPLAKADAENSTQWRVEMWRIVALEIPKYLVVGKGYTLNPADLYLANQAALRGLVKNYEVALVAGAYHSGPLSLIIPFGIFGCIGFLWLIVAGLWVLYRNYRYGDSSLQLANTFLLAYFITRVIMFFFVFGAISSDFYKFTGILGLSVAINRGVRKPAQEPLEEPAGLSLQPASA